MGSVIRNIVLYAVVVIVSVWIGVKLGGGDTIFDGPRSDRPIAEYRITPTSEGTIIVEQVGRW